MRNYQLYLRMEVVVRDRFRLQETSADRIARIAGGTYRYTPWWVKRRIRAALDLASQREKGEI